MALGAEWRKKNSDGVRSGLEEWSQGGVVGSTRTRELELDGDERAEYE